MKAQADGIDNPPERTPARDFPPSDPGVRRASVLPPYMNCITCGESAGYNRAVVDRLRDAVLGGFCRGCEDQEFGRSLERGRWACVDGCAFCDRDAFFALPRWESRTREDENGDVVCYVEYEVEDWTVELCDEHLHEFKRAHEGAVATKPRPEP